MGICTKCGKYPFCDKIEMNKKECENKTKRNVIWKE